MALVCGKAGAIAALKICSLRRTSDGNTYDDDENICNDSCNEYTNVVYPPPEKHIEVDSATIYLLHKAIRGLWSTVQNVAWEIGLRGDNVHTLLSSYVDSLNSAFKIVRDYATATNDNSHFQDVRSSKDDDNTPSMIPSSDMSDMSSSCESDLQYIATGQEDELALQSTDLITDEKIYRLGYDIKQVDISQMEHTVSHQSDTTEDTNQLVHTLTNDDDDDDDCDDKSQTICSSHHDEEEDSVDEFLQRNAHIIEGYFDENTEQDVAPESEKKDTDRNLSFSWMIVDKEGPMTRMSNSIQQ
eukprot:974891_1